MLHRDGTLLVNCKVFGDPSSGVVTAILYLRSSVQNLFGLPAPVTLGQCWLRRPASLQRLQHA